MINIKALHAAFQEIGLSGKHCVGQLNALGDDDSALLATADSPVLALTTDFINSSPALVELGLDSAPLLGQLVVAHNVSDLCGSGAQPIAFLLGCCFERDTSEQYVLEFFSGAHEAAQRMNCPIIGGDTKFGNYRSIYGTAIGRLGSANGALKRTNAHAGDLIFVSGNLGTFASAVVCLGNASSMPHRLVEWALSIVRTFEVPLEVSGSLSKLGWNLAGTDISDGLGTDLDDICRSSEVSAEINVQDVPLHPYTHEIAAYLGVKPWAFAFASGGDFQFICSCPAHGEEIVQQLGLKLIGRFGQLGESTIIANGVVSPLPCIGHVATRSLSFVAEIEGYVRQWPI